MRAIRTIVACLLGTALVVAGCSASEELTSQDLDAVIYNIAPVNNAPEAIHVCNRKPGQGVLMSFDDYGTDQQVHAILDRLRFHHMRAVFFPTGAWAEQHLDLIDQMKMEGHMVGNHTYTHADLGELSVRNEAQFYSEIYPLKGVANTFPMLLRPPFEAGAYDAIVGERLTDNNAQGCTWTADTRDWRGGGVEQIMGLLMHGDMNAAPLGPDGVILSHMHAQHTPAVIDAVVQYLSEKGWAYERTA